MKSELIETGLIVNTHGIRGCLRLQPWADSPELLCGIEHIYIDGKKVKVLSAKVHRGGVIVSLEGVGNVESAIRLKNKVVCVKRRDIAPPEGTYFIADLIGMAAIESDTGICLGKIADVLTLPANNVYVIDGGEREILVPAVPEFIEETNLEDGFIRFRLIEGL